MSVKHCFYRSAFSQAAFIKHERMYGFCTLPNFAYGKLVADFVRRFLLFLKDFTGHRLTMFCLTAKRAVSVCVEGGDSSENRF